MRPESPEPYRLRFARRLAVRRYLDGGLDQPSTVSDDRPATGGRRLWPAIGGSGLRSDIARPHPAAGELVPADGTGRERTRWTRVRRPLVIAHRGSSAAAPEHTLAAYLRAIEEGADGVECDVRLTRDGHLVCVHDRRLERTSNGRGLVSTHTLAELDELDFGSWHPGPDDDEPVYDLGLSDTAPARILTLDHLLDAVRAAGRPIRLLIETKHPTRYGADVELTLVDALRRHGLHEPSPAHPVSVTVMSFSALAVRRVRRLAPLLPTVMLLELLPPGLRAGRLPFGADIGGPGIGLLRTHPELVERLHQRGREVYVWTVNDRSDVDLVVALGAEAIISDRPGHVLRRLAELGLDGSGGSGAAVPTGE